MEEPGIDIAEWTAEWAAIEDDVRDAPADALSDLDDLVGRMMAARGFATAEREGEDTPANDATREFVNAHAITRQVGAAEDVDPGDIAYAVNAYRELYEELLAFGADRGAPA